MRMEFNQRVDKFVQREAAFRTADEAIVFDCRYTASRTKPFSANLK
jgi:hypothetical protein